MRSKTDGIPLFVTALAASCALGLVAPGRGMASPHGDLPGAPRWIPMLVAVQQPPASQDEFVPVKDLPVQEQLPAAPLLIGAYSFVWLMLVVYVVVLWRRLGSVEREIQGLQRRISPATTGDQRRA